MKFPIEGRVAFVRDRQDESGAVYMAPMAKAEEEEEIHPEVIEVRNESKK